MPLKELICNVPELLCDLQAKALVLQSLTFRLSAVSTWSISLSLFFFVETKGEKEREGEGREVVCTYMQEISSACRCPVGEHPTSC